VIRPRTTADRNAKLMVDKTIPSAFRLQRERVVECFYEVGDLPTGPWLESFEACRRGIRAHHAMTRMRGLSPSEREIAQPQVGRGEKDGHRSYDGAFLGEFPE
jgi:hypothetical protein